MLERVSRLPAIAETPRIREPADKTPLSVLPEPSQNEVSSLSQTKQRSPAKTPREPITIRYLDVEPIRTQPYPVWQIAPDTVRCAEPLPDIGIVAPLLEPRYPTRWREAVTLEELLTDNQVRKVAFAKARSLGYTDQDAEDCFQLGSINLWKALQEQPTLLRDKGAAWVGIWIAFSGSRRALWKHAARAVSFDDPDLDWQTADERLLLYQRSRPERWAAWATRVDERIDFELLICTLAYRYEHDHLKLLALYALTTSVKMKDVANMAGINKKRFACVVGNAVKDDIRALLECDMEAHLSDEFWTDQLQRGKNLDCVTRVAERVLENQRLLLALYIVTTSATRKDVAELFGIRLTAFRKDIIRIKLLLAEEFRKRCRGTAS